MCYCYQSCFGDAKPQILMRSPFCSAGEGAQQTRLGYNPTYASIHASSVDTPLTTMGRHRAVESPKCLINNIPRPKYEYATAKPAVPTQSPRGMYLPSLPSTTGYNEHTENPYDNPVRNAEWNRLHRGNDWVKQESAEITGLPDEENADSGVLGPGGMELAWDNN
eukprot:m.896708 g.896708  ORF g.896708 m.896708 type:complete len:165 (-) comp23667_c0_seq10:191-685(-)